MTKKRHRHYTKGMSQRSLIGIIAGVILLLIVGIFALNSDLFKKKEAPTQTKTAVPTSIPTPTSIPGESILFTGLKFTPATTQLELGDVVNFANLGEEEIIIQTKTSSEEGRKLSVGSVLPGDTSIFIKFDKAGTYEYVNSLNPEQSGRIIVR